MYSLRRFASRHSRAYEAVYNASSPIILSTLRLINKLVGARLNTPITWLEAKVKGVLFDCKMCGNCVLSSTGMTCPMNCPKTIRNGPCGGVRENGNCEVNADMKCVWVDAWDGAQKMQHSREIELIQFAPNQQHQGSSAWIRLSKESANKKLHDIELEVKP
ncbi:MAG: hypothetical protein ACJAYF_001332 [Arenicella sp.]|jgi:hypothetical protein